MYPEEMLCDVPFRSYGLYNLQGNDHEHELVFMMSVCDGVIYEQCIAAMEEL